MGHRPFCHLPILFFALFLPLLLWSSTALDFTPVSHSSHISTTKTADFTPKTPENPSSTLVFRTVTPSSPRKTYYRLTGGIAFEATEAEDLTVMGTSPYLPKVNVSRLLTAAYPVTLSAEGVQVIICHTHTTEAYAPTAEFRSENPEENILRVGEEIADALRSQGISVLHDTDFHDKPSFAYAYQSTLDALTPLLRAHPSVTVILDVHRDAYALEGVQQPYLTELEGVSAAQLLLVVGDGGNYDYEGWQDNLNFALKLYAEANREAPTLVRGLRLDHARYNQHLMPGAMLLEVGSAGNTLPQALTAARKFGEIFAEMLKSLPQTP